MSESTDAHCKRQDPALWKVLCWSNACKLRYTMPDMTSRALKSAPSNVVAFATGRLEDTCPAVTWMSKRPSDALPLPPLVSSGSFSDFISLGAGLRCAPERLRTPP